MQFMQLIHYETPAGKDVFAEWLHDLRDRVARANIQRRVDRVIRDNFGDIGPCGDGVEELRIHHGPGYRVYFGRSGDELVLLLCGGDKGSQESDIKKAKLYWADWKQRNRRSS